jgi:hypothetical protein
MTSKSSQQMRETLIKKGSKFMEMLKTAEESQQKVLFIRSEEQETYKDRGKRISFPEYEQRYQQDEVVYLRQFSSFLTEKYPKLSFQILFMNSKGGEAMDRESKIIAIAAPDCDYRDHKVGQKMIEAVVNGLASVVVDEHA